MLTMATDKKDPNVSHSVPFQDAIDRLEKRFSEQLDERQFDIYIKPRGGLVRESPETFPLTERLMTFVNDSTKASLLLLGDPGQGKTLLSLWMAQYYWKEVKKASKQNLFCLPVWIWLPGISLEKRDTELLETHFYQQGLLKDEIKRLQSACQENRCQLLVILDGLDEIAVGEENFYLKNGWWNKRWPQLKAMTFSRPEAFAYHAENLNYQRLFYTQPWDMPQANATFLELYLQPFNESDIQAYLTAYVTPNQVGLSDPKIRDGNNETPAPLQALFDALSDGSSLDEIKALLQTVDVNARMPGTGATALHQAAAQASAELIDLLLKAGADPSIRDRGDETPGQWAEANQRPDIVDLLSNQPVEQKVEANNRTPLDWADWRTYEYYIKTIKPLAVLAQNPFVLSILMQALPSIVADVIAQTQPTNYSTASPDMEAAVAQLYTRERVYRVFVQDWLKRQAERLWKDPEKQKVLNELGSFERLIGCLFTYSENLARLALNVGGGKLDAILTEEMTLRAELLSAPYGSELYFTIESSLATVLPLIRSGCLLKCQGQTYRFLHKTIVEYLAARSLFNSAHIAAEAYVKGLQIDTVKELFSFNDQSLLKEPQIILMLADLVEANSSFKKLLYDVIELSKEEPLLEIAAANAITILNVAGESFSGKDFRGIHIAGADLSGAICHKTNFSGADLRSVIWQHVWIQSANFEGACLENVDFAEFPKIEHDCRVTTMALDPKGEWLLIGDMKGYLTKWSLSKRQPISQWKINPYSTDVKLGGMVGFQPLSALTISPSGNFAAVGTFDGAIHILDLNRWKIIKRLATAATKTRETFRACRISVMAFLAAQEHYLIIGGDIKAGFSGESGLQIWDINQGQKVSELEGSYGYDLALSPDGKTLVSSSYETLYFYHVDNLQPGNNFHNYFSCPLKDVSDVAFSPHGKWLGVVIKGKIQLWDVQEMKVIKVLQQENPQQLFAIAFSLDNELVVSFASTGLQVWHVESGRYLASLACPFSISAATDIPSQNPIFFPSLKEHRIYYSINNEVNVWNLQTFSHLFKRCYPTRKASFLPTGEKQLASGKEVSLTSEGLQVKAKVDGTKGEIQLIKHNQSTQTLCFATKGLTNFAGEHLALLLSPHQCYLVFAYVDTYGFEQALEVVGSGLMNQLVPMFTETKIWVWDVTQGKQLHIFSHHNQIISMLFSANSEWLITAGRTVRIWDIASGKCLHRYDEHAFWADAVAISSHKKWLAIVDGKGSLGLWETHSHQRIALIPSMQVRVRKAAFTHDNMYLVCWDEKGLELTFHIKANKALTQVDLTLISLSSFLNLNCQNARLTNVRNLSKENQLLLKQRGAVGECAPEHLGSDASRINDTKAFHNLNLIQQGLQFQRTVVDRRVMSVLNDRYPIDYHNWAISFLRDTESQKNDAHTFLIVEGMNAYGRLVFYRYDLATRVNGETITPGFAKVVIETKANVPLDMQKERLNALINPRGEKGRGVESIVGFAWSVSRKEALLFDQWMQADRAQGLIKYHTLGDSALTSQEGHNCYTWAREKLLRLNNSKIEADLPKRYLDYLGVHPKLHLTLAPEKRTQPQERSCLVM